MLSRRIDDVWKIHLIETAVRSQKWQLCDVWREEELSLPSSQAVTGKTFTLEGIQGNLLHIEVAKQITSNDDRVIEQGTQISLSQQISSTLSRNHKSQKLKQDS